MHIKKKEYWESSISEGGNPCPTPVNKFVWEILLYLMYKIKGEKQYQGECGEVMHRNKLIMKDTYCCL